jgi:23S rRNA (adenine1618-N6)-methyltransferase
MDLLVDKQDALENLENIDFNHLAKSDNEFSGLWRTSNKRLNFKNADHQRVLTKAILRQYFKLSIELPDGRLIPPVPVRYEYIKWIQRLLDTTSGNFSSVDYDPSRSVFGLDVGVGASCIYPLLGCATRPNWRFYGTDIDEQSLLCAAGNVARNNLMKRIQLRLMTPTNTLFPLDILGAKALDFTMCNPPFYSSAEEIENSASLKDFDPYAVCTGAEVEMITEGGEAGFASEMIGESFVLQARAQWYTIMLSKKENVGLVVDKLKQFECKNWVITQLKPGAATVRWVIGWSWRDLRAPPDVGRNASGIDNKLLPFHPEAVQKLDGRDALSVADTVNNHLSTLDLNWEYDCEKRSGIALAKGDVWSRHYRRQKQRGEVKLGDEIKTGARVGITNDALKIEWIQGFDEKLFESFYTMVTRQSHSIKQG